jgi:hypothetical protein
MISRDLIRKSRCVISGCPLIDLGDLLHAVPDREGGRLGSAAVTGLCWHLA